MRLCQFVEKPVTRVSSSPQKIAVPENVPIWKPQNWLAEGCSCEVKKEKRENNATSEREEVNITRLLRGEYKQ